jgi:glucose-1-phosphate cytidylyltransferase
VDLSALLTFHRSHGRLATLTAVRPPVRFGELSIEKNRVAKFQEKPQAGEGWINGGFFCLNKSICSFIMDLTTSFESEPLNHLVSIEQLSAFEHHGWWQPMDTLRDKRTLESIWQKGEAPWLMA